MGATDELYNRYAFTLWLGLRALNLANGRQTPQARLDQATGGPGSPLTFPDIKARRKASRRSPFSGL